MTLLITRTRIRAHSWRKKRERERVRKGQFHIERILLNYYFLECILKDTSFHIEIMLSEDRVGAEVKCTGLLGSPSLKMNDEQNNLQV